MFISVYNGCINYFKYVQTISGQVPKRVEIVTHVQFKIPTLQATTPFMEFLAKSQFYFVQQNTVGMLFTHTITKGM